MNPGSSRKKSTLLPTLAVLTFALCLVSGASWSRADETVVCGVRAALSSAGSISRPLTEALQNAHAQVLVALYGFNNPVLAHELAKLSQRGVDVRVKIDADKAAGRKTSELITVMRRAGVTVQAVAPDGRNHNKFVVIDGRQVITGSYNWTMRAEQNWENLLFLDCPELARRYQSEWQKVQ